MGIQLRTLTACKCSCESFQLYITSIITAAGVIKNLSIRQLYIASGVMGGIQSRSSLDKEAEINTRAGDKKRMKKIDKDIRKTFFFDKDMMKSVSEMAAIMEQLFK